ncbi:MAG: hypothetical protein NC253_10305 [Ruminococcus sp.]|nr:hypothetical protein [Ruminococcus sp.]MCM1381339.1 hypothetical protein [Muribaculaceae bacterium]MCM1479221.1 hypothetical protein [Muribaculaceae bacterium]
MSKIFKAAKTAAVSILCAAGMLSLSGCENYGKMLKESPADYVDLAVENTMEAMGGFGFAEESKIIEQALGDGSFSLGFEVEGIAFSGVCETKEDAMSQLYTISNGEGNSAQIYLYGDESGMKFGTVGESGSHIYDLTLEGMAERLAASIFAPGSGSVYELSQEDYDIFAEYAEVISAAAAGTSESGDKYRKLTEDFRDGLSPVTEENADITVGGETVKANVVTYSVTKEQIKDFLDRYADIAAEDGQFSSEMSGMSEEEFRAQLDGAMADIENLTVDAVYYVNAKTHMLMQSDISVNAAAEGKTAEVKLNSVFGADPAAAEKQTHTLYVTAEGESTEIVMDVTHTDTSSTVKANMTSGGESAELFTLTAEKNDGSYSLSLDIMGTVTAGVDGTVSASGNALNLTVDKVYASYGEGEVSYSPKVNVDVKKGGEISALDAQGEFLDITEEELNAFGESIVNDFAWIFDGAYDSELYGDYE